jgi:flagellar basal-body rod protein FlgG
MLRGLYAAAFGMMNSQTKQDVTANNIANAETAGYKQDKVVSKTFPEVMIQNKSGGDSEHPKVQELGTMPFGVETEGIYTDFNAGNIEETGNKLDFALQGTGFFTIRYFDGISENIRYTRDGNFKLDGQGNLVTSDGGYVLGYDVSTRRTGPMKLGTGDITVGEDGGIYANSQKKYNFMISDFNDYNGIEKLGNNMYDIKADNGAQAVTLKSGEYSIDQGKLEQSNVDMTDEMVSMMTNLRNYQMNQRVLQSLDQTLEKAVNEVGSLK